MSIEGDLSNRGWIGEWERKFAYWPTLAWAPVDGKKAFDNDRNYGPLQCTWWRWYEVRRYNFRHGDTHYFKRQCLDVWNCFGLKYRVDLGNF